MPSNRHDSSDFLGSKLGDWQEHHTVGYASDLVGAGIVLGRTDEVVEAAEFLLQEAAKTTTWMRELAEHSLGRATLEVTQFEPPTIDRSLFHRNIRRVRSLLRTEPRDPVTWVELARQYACIGLGDQASRSMIVAVQLAKDNRFVLRSASRLWVSLDDPERAHAALVNGDRTRSDPWLLAAEIAVSSVVNKSSRFVNIARNMVSRHVFPAAHTSELAAALATLELSSGSVRKSKSWFNYSLEDPTENSVAQASWASLLHGAVDFGGRFPALPNMFEADAWRYYQEGRWRDMLEKCKLWFLDQPFSNSPCILGSFVAATALEDYPESERIARMGLVANPNDFMLLNNLAFTLMSAGKIEEAKAELARIDASHLKEAERIILEATKGLREFRFGEPTRGRELYVNAALRARKIGDTTGQLMFALASVFHAIEEAQKDSDLGMGILQEALRIAEMQRDPIFRVLADRLRNAMKGVNRQ